MVSKRSTGKVILLAVVHPEGDGFPSGFAGDGQLGRPDSVVFVVDSDDELRTPDVFPEGVRIRILVTAGMRSASGEPLEGEIVVTTERDGS